MIRKPGMLARRYENTRMKILPDGKRMLANLPKPQAEQQREIGRILSAYHCTSCAKCCRGFAFGEDDPNFKSVMEAVRKKKKRFVVEPMGRGRSGYEYYEVGPHMEHSAACAFLKLKGGKISLRTLIHSDGKEKKDSFGCEIYAARASSCIIYPLSMAWIGLILENGKRDSDGIIMLDYACPAIGDLVESGIGHLEEKEIFSLINEGRFSSECLLVSFSAGIMETVKRIREGSGRTHILVNEEGERIYPINAWQISL